MALLKYKAQPPVCSNIEKPLVPNRVSMFCKDDIPLRKSSGPQWDALLIIPSEFEKVPWKSSEKQVYLTIAAGVPET